MLNFVDDLKQLKAREREIQKIIDDRLENYDVEQNLELFIASADNQQASEADSTAAGKVPAERVASPKRGAKPPAPIRRDSPSKSSNKEGPPAPIRIDSDDGLQSATMESLLKQVEVIQKELSDANQLGFTDDVSKLNEQLQRLTKEIAQRNADSSMFAELGTTNGKPPPPTPSRRDGPQQESSAAAPAPAPPARRDVLSNAPPDLAIPTAELESKLTSVKRDLQEATELNFVNDMQTLRGQRDRIESELRRRREEEALFPELAGSTPGSRTGAPAPPTRRDGELSSTPSSSAAVVAQLEEELKSVKKDLQDARELNFVDDIETLSQKKAALEQRIESAKNGVDTFTSRAPAPAPPARRDVLSNAPPDLAIPTAELESKLTSVKRDLQEATELNFVNDMQTLRGQRDRIESELRRRREEEALFPELAGSTPGSRTGAPAPPTRRDGELSSTPSSSAAVVAQLEEELKSVKKDLQDARELNFVDDIETLSQKKAALEQRIESAKNGLDTFTSLSPALVSRAPLNGGEQQPDTTAYITVSEQRASRLAELGQRVAEAKQELQDARELNFVDDIPRLAQRKDALEERLEVEEQVNKRPLPERVVKLEKALRKVGQQLQSGTPSSTTERELQRRKRNIVSELTAEAKQVHDNDSKFRLALQSHLRVRELDAKLELAEEMGRTDEARRLREELRVKEDELSLGRSMASKEDQLHLSRAMQQVKSRAGSLVEPGILFDESSDDAEVKRIENELKFNDLQLKVARANGDDEKVSALRDARRSLTSELAQATQDNERSHANDSVISLGQRLDVVEKELQDARDLHFTDDIPKLLEERDRLKQSLERLDANPASNSTEREVSQLEADLRQIDDSLVNAIENQDFEAAKRIVRRRPPAARALQEERAAGTQESNSSTNNAELQKLRRQLHEVESMIADVDESTPTERVQKLTRQRRTIASKLVKSGEAPKATEAVTLREMQDPVEARVLSRRAAILQAEFAVVNAQIAETKERAQRDGMAVSQFEMGALQRRRQDIGRQLKKAMTPGVEEARLADELETVQREMEAAAQTSPFEKAKLRARRDAIENELGAVREQEARLRRRPPPVPPRADRLIKEIETVGRKLEREVNADNYQEAERLVATHKSLAEQLEKSRAPPVPPRIRVLQQGETFLLDELEREAGNTKKAEELRRQIRFLQLASANLRAEPDSSFRSTNDASTNSGVADKQRALNQAVADNQFELAAKLQQELERMKAGGGSSKFSESKAMEDMEGALPSDRASRILVINRDLQEVEDELRDAVAQQRYADADILSQQRDFIAAELTRNQAELRATLEKPAPQSGSPSDDLSQEDVDESEHSTFASRTTDKSPVGSPTDQLKLLGRPGDTGRLAASRPHDAQAERNDEVVEQVRAELRKAQQDLQDAIELNFTDEVSQLREARDALRTKLNALEQSSAATDAPVAKSPVRRIASVNDLFQSPLAVRSPTSSSDQLRSQSASKPVMTETKSELQAKYVDLKKQLSEA